MPLIIHAAIDEWRSSFTLPLIHGFSSHQGEGGATLHESAQSSSPLLRRSPTIGWQDICYRSEALNALFGVARGLPIARGGGLEQAGRASERAGGR